MKIIKGKHCSNCYHCRTKLSRAWCKQGLWAVNKYDRAIKIEVDSRCISVNKQYQTFAEQCPDYQGMEG